MLPIEEYKVYGPYMHEGEGRRIVALVSKNHRTSMSYARYLMVVHLGRWLTSDETVDHINGDKLDDRVENFQILTRGDNVRKSHSGPITTQHGTLSMVRYCKPICEECREVRNKYNREYLQEKRKVDPNYGRNR